MSDKIKEMLDETIEMEIRAVNSLLTGSENKEAAIDDLVRLYKLRIEETKNEMELREKHEARIMEWEEKKSERFMVRDTEDRKQKELLSEQVKDRYLRVGIATAEIVLPLTFYAVWMNKGFKFEETGAFTSTTFRGLFSRFRPTKK